MELSVEPERDLQPAAPPRVRTSSVADAWSGFMVELEAASPSLFEVISRRGRLAEFQGGRATVKLSKLQDEERLLIESRRNQRTCSRAFTTAIGREVEVVFEDAATARPGGDDPFTQEVKDLFQGRIED